MEKNNLQNPELDMVPLTEPYPFLPTMKTKSSEKQEVCFGQNMPEAAPKLNLCFIQKTSLTTIDTHPQANQSCAKHKTTLQTLEMNKVIF